MNTTTFQITVPTADVSMLKKLIAGMGWTMSALTPKRKAGIERGLEDIKKGNVYRAENSADLVKQIFGQYSNDIIYNFNRLNFNNKKQKVEI